MRFSPPLVVTFLVAGFYSFSFSQSTIKIACVGDYGTGTSVQNVANMIAGWDPDLVFTTGDNNYTANNTSVASWDNEIGQYYGQYIRFPVGISSTYAPGPSINKFFPALGNHDWDADISGWYNYFDLPGNERYYDVVRGPVHLFFLSSDPREPDGIASTSAQAQWLQTGLANSASPWKIVVFHHPAYSSSSHGNTVAMQWPFAAWGASMVFNGHDHTYERIVKNNFNYIVNGLGGRPTYGFNATPEPGSVVRYNASNGAMLIQATPLLLTVKCYAVGGALVDSISLSSPLVPIQLASFTGTVITQNRVRLDWTTASEVNNYGFEIQKRSDALPGFQTIPNSFIPGHGTTIQPHSYYFTDSAQIAGHCFYRLKIIALDGDVEYSEPITVSTPTDVHGNASPHHFSLEQNFPNPFNPSTTIRYSLSHEGHVKLKVFSSSGGEVVTLVDEIKSAGLHGIQFNTKSLSSGIYFYRLETEGFSQTRRLVILK
ncbi:MAG: metallophosphoesterase [bacterium]